MLFSWFLQKIFGKSTTHWWVRMNKNHIYNIYNGYFIRFTKKYVWNHSPTHQFIWSPCPCWDHLRRGTSMGMPMKAIWLVGCVRKVMGVPPVMLSIQKSWGQNFWAPNELRAGHSTRYASKSTPFTMRKFCCAPGSRAASRKLGIWTSGPGKNPRCIMHLEFGMKSKYGFRDDNLTIQPDFQQK